MFSIQNYEAMLFWREKITEFINDPTCETVPVDALRRLNETQALFDKDIEEGMRFIKERARDNVARIHMPIPPPKMQLEDGHELTIKSYIRVITLPDERAPFYYGVLYTEADSLVREWCEISLGRFKP